MTTKSRKAFENLIKKLTVSEEILYEYAETVVARVAFDKASETLSIVLKHEQLIPARLLNEFQEQLINSLSEYQAVEIINHFPESLLEATISEYWPQITEQIKAASASFNLLDTAK